jgi:hypothetical protein
MDPTEKDIMIEMVSIIEVLEMKDMMKMIRIHNSHEISTTLTRCRRRWLDRK